MAFPVAITLASVLGYIAVSLVTRVLLALGFTVATYTGVGALMTQAESFVFSNFGATSASILQVLAMARIDDFLRLIFSAYSATLVLKGLNAAGSIMRGKWSAPSGGA